MRTSDAAVRSLSQEECFLAALRRTLGPGTRPIALHEPEFAGNEWTYLKDCLDSTFVSSIGKYVDQFEAMLASYTGARHAIAVVNGTAALQIAVQLSGVKPGDEVIVPALSFVATANAVVHCGAHPHFVDSSETTLGLDPSALSDYLSRIAEVSSAGLRNVQTGRRIAAIVPMHTFGHPVDLDGLLEVAGRFDLPMVEDAAESLGSFYRGRHTGTFGRLGVLSFNGNKIVTTGGGGAMLTNDPALARHAKHLTTTAKLPHRWEFVHDEIAWNYRMPNLNAALGCAQLERLADMLARKRLVAERYRESFASVPGLTLVSEPSHSRSNYWLNAVRLATPDKAARDALLTAANDAGYHCRPTWTLLHTLHMYRDSPRSPLPVAEALEASLINLPSAAALAHQPA